MMLRRILKQLVDTGTICVIYRKGDISTGVTCIIKDYDNWHIQIDEYVYHSMELWSQSMIAIEDISKLDYYHKGARANAQRNGVYVIEPFDSLSIESDT